MVMRTTVISQSQNIILMQNLFLEYYVAYNTNKQVWLFSCGVNTQSCPCLWKLKDV